MKTKLIITTLIFSAFILKVSAQETALPDSRKRFHYTETSDQIASISFEPPHYTIEDIEIEGDTYQKVVGEYSVYTTREGYPQLPVYSGLFQVDPEGAYILENIRLTEDVITEFKAYPLQSNRLLPSNGEFIRNGEFYENGQLYPAEAVILSEPVIMRDQRMVNIAIKPFRFDPVRNELRVVTELNFDLRKLDLPGKNCKNTSKKRSRFFESLYDAVTVNNVPGERDTEYQQPCYLFIYPDNALVANELAVLTAWKHRKGFEVHAVNTSETGTDLNDIKAYIQNAYDNWENPPEFVCLVGDAGGNFSIPTGHLDGGMYNGEGDHFYTLLEGDDILADVFIGRLSFNDILEFQTILAKIISYEKEPYLDNLDWYNRSLMLGDPTDSGPSTITTNQSIVEMIDYEAPEMECVEVYSGNWVNQIGDNLNQGVLYFHYRGFANMSGWDNVNTNSLNNGFMLPAVTHITCVTGDFEGTVDCRSEAFLKAGSPSTPKGAIAAVGTATGYTHTCFNNIVSAGIFFGIFQDRIYNMGGALTRGKVALYNNYPGNPANHVSQFSYWNNLMGDPGMELWTGVPQNLVVEYQENVPLGTNYLEVTVSNENSDPLSGAWVTALLGDDDIFATGFTQEDGKVMLPISADIEGEVYLTVTAHNFIPHLGSFEIYESDVFVNSENLVIDDDNSGGSSGNSDSLINPGETIELFVELRNHGNSMAYGIELTAECSNPQITIIDNVSGYGSIPAQSTAEPLDPLILEISNSALNLTEFQLELIIEDVYGNSWEDLAELTVTGPYLSVAAYQVHDENDFFETGETVEITVSLYNSGYSQVDGIEGILSCSNSYISINDDSGYFGSIEAGGQSENNGDTFTVSANNAVINGSQIQFDLELTNSEGFLQNLVFPVTVGEITENDPVGPDAYGYYCYDDSDIGYYSVPVYQWIEIDPQYGGQGTSLNLVDFGNMGAIAVVDIPIEFSFYGQVYDQVTIASDGWISPGVTDQTAFMNWQLPGLLGPSPMIAAFWDDLIIDQGNVFYYYNEESHYFVIEWSRLNNEFNFAEETFEIILYDANHYPTSNGDSEILIQYRTVSNIDMGIYGTPLVQHGQYSTVGIEDESGTIGLQYTFNNQYPPGARELEDEMALLFTGPPINQEEPFLVISEIILDDENLNGQVDYGETVDFYIRLNNLGSNSTSGISAEISSSDQYIEILNAGTTYPDIEGYGSQLNQEAFSFTVPADCPDEHIIAFNLDVESNESSWNLNFNLDNNAPLIENNSFFVDDGINHILDPGETAEVIFSFINLGGADAFNVEIELSSQDPYINVGSGTGSFPLFQADEIVQIVLPVTISPSAPIGYCGNIDWSLTADLDYESSGTIEVYIAQVPVNLSEGFDFFPPVGWSFEGGYNWLVVYSNVLGGEIPEVIFFWISPEYTEQRMISPVINTLGSTSLELQFRQLVYTEISDFELKLVTSSDGVNWHEFAEIPVENTAPMISNYTITNSDVGSPEFRFAFQASGSTQGVLQWILDDVEINEVEAVPHGFIAGNITLNGGNGNVQEAMISVNEDNYAFPDEEGNYVLSVEPGIYDVTARLPGYIAEIANDVEVSEVWQTTFQDFELSELTQDYNPQNLTAVSNALDIILNWDVPGTDPPTRANNDEKGSRFSRELLGYNIYRDNILIGQNDDLNQTQYTDEMMDNGTYTYHVTALYTEGESQPSNVIEFEHEIPRPQNLNAIVTPNTIHILLNWQSPPGMEGMQILYRVYCNGELITETYQFAYLHANAPWGTLTYGVTAVYYDSFESYPVEVTIEHTTSNDENLLPLVTSLDGNHPNPFNPETEINYQVSETGHVCLSIWNIRGQLVKKLVNEIQVPGRYSAAWNGRDEENRQVGSGLYFYRMKTESYSNIRKMVLMK